MRFLGVVVNTLGGPILSPYAYGNYEEIIKSVSNLRKINLSDKENRFATAEKLDGIGNWFTKYR